SATQSPLLGAGRALSSIHLPVGPVRAVVDGHAAVLLRVLLSNPRTPGRANQQDNSPRRRRVDQGSVRGGSGPAAPSLELQDEVFVVLFDFDLEAGSVRPGVLRGEAGGFPGRAFGPAGADGDGVGPGLADLQGERPVRGN